MYLAENQKFGCLLGVGHSRHGFSLKIGLKIAQSTRDGPWAWKVSFLYLASFYFHDAIKNCMNDLHILPGPLWGGLQDDFWCQGLNEESLSAGKAGSNQVEKSRYALDM
jgi:hypothetical protein